MKLISLLVVKSSTLDPFGCGIEMEADKPGWCDAINGGPGLFGSSLHEMFELIRLIRFIESCVIPESPTKAVDFPSEVFSFMREVGEIVSHGSHKDFRPTWDNLCLAREHFREKTFFGLSGKLRSVRISDVSDFLNKVSKLLSVAESHAVDPKYKLPTSYFTHEVEASKIPHDWKTHLYKIPWQQHRLPPFLEGAVHALKLWAPDKAKKLYKAVQKSELYDKKLGMYRLNSSLSHESSELGRIRVFSKGWLENESIFLHMHYKYLLEILKSGLIAEFFNEVKTGLIPFRDMATYGRPIFENSSFIASSAFPKKEFHGRGYVARLSGATSEFMSMVYFLVFGPQFFKKEGEAIVFSPEPKLPGEWFTKKEGFGSPKNSVSLNLFGVPVTLVNPLRRDTFGARRAVPKSFEWILEGRFYSHEGPTLQPEASLALREGRLEALTVFLNKP